MTAAPAVTVFVFEHAPPYIIANYAIKDKVQKIHKASTNQQNIKHIVLLLFTSAKKNLSRGEVVYMHKKSHLSYIEKLTNPELQPASWWKSFEGNMAPQYK